MERLFRGNHQELYPAGHLHSSGEWECQGGLRDLEGLKKQQTDPFSAISAPVLPPALSHHCPCLNDKVNRVVCCEHFEAPLAYVFHEIETKKTGLHQQLPARVCATYFPASCTACTPEGLMNNIHLHEFRVQEFSYLPNKWHVCI